MNFLCILSINANKMIKENEMECIITELIISRIFNAKAFVITSKYSDWLYFFGKFWMSFN